MKRKLFIFIAVMSLIVTSPIQIFAVSTYLAGVMDLTDTEVSVTYSQGVLYVNGAEDMVLEVVSLTGKKVVEEQVDSPAWKIELNIPKGCYIVKVGTVVRKISVR